MVDGREAVAEDASAFEKGKAKKSKAPQVSWISTAAVYGFGLLRAVHVCMLSWKHNLDLAAQKGARISSAAKGASFSGDPIRFDERHSSHQRISR